jgi:hypothetical protein
LSVINVQKKKSLQEFGFIPCGKVLHSICSWSKTYWKKIPKLYKITTTGNWDPSHIVHQKYHNEVANQLFNICIWLLDFVPVVFKIV